jgi:hypothetical protein
MRYYNYIVNVIIFLIIITSGVSGYLFATINDTNIMLEENGREQ